MEDAGLRKLVSECRYPRLDKTLLLISSAGFKYMEALGRIIIGGPYPPSNAIIYMHLQL